MLWLFVGPTRVYLLDFFCSGIQFYLLLSPYLLLYLLVIYWFICFGRWCIGGLGVFHAGQISICLDPHLNWGWGWRRWTGLSPPVKYFTDRSRVVLLLWIFYVFVLSCVYCVFVHVCLCVLCGHLRGGGWPLGSRLWSLIVSLSLSHWYPGSGVVLDCIDSWSLHPYLLLLCYFTIQ